MSNKEETNRKATVIETLNKVNEIMKNEDVDQITLYYLIKDFLKKYLEINYEFTHKEALKELDRTYIDTKIKSDITGLIQKISIIEYSDEELKKDEIKKILIYFYYILKELYQQYKEQKKLVNKIKSIFSKS